jgi:hypothetical protein
MMHLNEIKFYTFSRVGYIMTVPVVIPIESEVFKAGERLRELHLIHLEHHFSPIHG